MDFIRSNVLRRGASSSAQGQDLEQQRQLESGDDEDGSRSRLRRFTLNQPQPPTVPESSSGGGRQLQRNTNIHGNETDSTKAPVFKLNLPTLPSTRLHLPNLARTWTRGNSGPPSPDLPTAEPTTINTPQPSLQQTRTRAVRFGPDIIEPQETHAREDLRGSNSSIGRRFRGTDPAEMHLADLAETGRRRRDRRAQEQRERPKRFLYCFPWIKSRHIRTQILKCFVSGMFLMLLLTIYLALSITKNINSPELTVLLILIILFTTIFFCHGLFRLCLLIIRPPPEEHRPRPQMLGPVGYAIPRRPIRVVLARDEEVAGLESETSKMQPPAYGLWRESVRVDPNRIYWQRNDQASISDEEGDHDRPHGVNRPPSYASEDGVEYVIEARPRSMAPQTEVPLPVHPSERGRVARPGSS